MVEKTDINELKRLAENAIEEYFENIDNMVDQIVSKIAMAHKIEDDDDLKFLKKKIMRGILKLDG